MEKKNILHVIDTGGVGGAETVFKNLCMSINSENYNSIALVKGPGWLRDSLVAGGVSIYEKNCKGSFNLVYLVYLIYVIKKEKINIIHSHLLGSNLYTCLASVFTGTPVISTFHGKVDFDMSGRLSKLKIKLISSFSEKIVFVSDSLKKYALDCFAFDKARIEVIYNGVEVPVTDRKAKEKEANLEGRVRLGALGNVRQAKNYENLIRALKILIDKGVDVEVIIAGDSENKLCDSLKLLAVENNIEERVSFIGYVEDVADFLKGLDVFVISSSSEGLPLSLIQAMMMGLPVVATRCGVEEFIDHGVEGLIVDNNSPSSLAEGVETMLDDKDGAAAYADVAQRKALELYGAKSMYLKYEELYEVV